LGLIGDQQYGSPLFIAVGVWFLNPSTTRFRIDGDQEAIGLGDQASYVFLGLIGDQQYGSPLVIAVGVWFPNPSATRFRIDGDQEAIGLGDQAPTVWTAIAFRFAPPKSLLKKGDLNISL
jgi:hypothetical protein